MESKKSLIARIADAIERKTDKLDPIGAAQARREALVKSQKPLRSKKARIFYRQPGSRFETYDGRLYGWFPRNDDAELRRSRGLWPKGHAGKVLRKKFRKLHHGGHHSVTTALHILGLSTDARA